MSCITGVRSSLYLLSAVLSILASCSALDSNGLVVVILSQSNPHHLRLATDLRGEILNQAQQLKTVPPIIHLSHKDFPHVGDWTILPLLPKLLIQYNTNNVSWFFFIEERTFINLGALLGVLSKYDHKEPQWLGHAVYDHEPTIIHHFAFHDNPELFKFPNQASGIAISGALVERLSPRVKHSESQPKDFTIDSAHEMALFIWDEGSGPTIKHEPAFCVEKAPNCASYPLPFRHCNKVVQKENIYFAVKTCAKFHKDRLMILKQTWGKHTVQMKFFSDEEDESLRTVSVGVPNTEFGHCKKSLEILKYVDGEIKNSTNIEWVVLADDDTILSVNRLRQLLGCYNALTPVVLGERYGFNLRHSQGYNYITGGGGIVFSRALLEKLVLSTCKCPTISSPDDMYLAGICIKLMGLAVTHSPLFHQARPNDYPPEYLMTKDAVSFHKHWMVDPVKVYEKWFQEDDMKRLTIKHEEL